MLHGSTWLSLKTTGDLYERAKRVRQAAMVAFGALLVVSAAATAFLVPEAFANGVSGPAGWLFAVLAFGGVALVAMGASKGADRTSFYGSALAGASMVGIWAASIFPALVPSIGPGEALTIANSQSSQLTLTVMLIIAAIGVPLCALLLLPHLQDVRRPHRTFGRGRHLLGTTAPQLAHRCHGVASREGRAVASGVSDPARSREVLGVHFGLKPTRSRSPRIGNCGSTCRPGR